MLFRSNEKELQLPIAETLSFSGANFSELIGGKIYIKPMLSFAQKQNYFKQENREYPVDFGVWKLVIIQFAILKS